MKKKDERKRKERKGKKKYLDWKGCDKTVLFEGDMIIYVKNPKL